MVLLFSAASVSTMKGQSWTGKSTDFLETPGQRKIEMDFLLVYEPKRNADPGGLRAINVRKITD